VNRKGGISYRRLWPGAKEDEKRNFKKEHYIEGKKKSGHRPVLMTMGRTFRNDWRRKAKL